MKLQQYSGPLLLLLAVVLVGGLFARDFLPNSRGQAQLQPGWRPTSFTLPDVEGQPQDFAELRGGERTHFMSLCGCARCQTYLTFVGHLHRKPGTPALRHIAMLTAPPEMEEAFRTNTEFDGAIVYEKKNGPMINYWQGEPCPRAYIIDEEGRLEWISPANIPDMPRIGLLYAAAIGVTQKPVLVEVMRELAEDAGLTDNLPSQAQLEATIDAVRETGRLPGGSPATAPPH